MEGPKIVLLLSAKRKSGKDYICERLQLILGEKCEIIRISGPLKQLYAEHHNLDWKELMSDSPYKEKYRMDMINWSDMVRVKDPGFFCRAACKAAKHKNIWIVSDIRRKTDIQWFKENYNNLKIIKVLADLEIRQSRGWIFTEGVDDVTSECDLDSFSAWDYVLLNNSSDDCEKAIETLLSITANV